MKKRRIIASMAAVLLTLCGTEVSAQDQRNQKQTEKMENKKITVEIWSDVMCPFCYIGKRKYEEALSKFNDKHLVETEWKSFQLNPDMITDPSKNTVQYLAETKGWTLEYTRNTIAHVTEMAKKAGLQYNFDKAVVANSFDAHRFIQFAKSKGKGDEAEERVFKAYFTEGQNTADHNVITRLAVEIGLNGEEMQKILSSSAYADEVNKDLKEAGQIGVTGVPFFVINRKFAISGAQDAQVFLKALEKALDDQEQSHQHKEGESCRPDGKCD